MVKRFHKQKKLVKNYKKINGSTKIHSKHQNYRNLHNSSNHKKINTVIGNTQPKTHIIVHEEIFAYVKLWCEFEPV